MQQPLPVGSRNTEEKRRASVRLAMWLSIIPGLGQLYNQKPKRGAFFFFGVIALLAITLNIPGATSQLLGSIGPGGEALGPATITGVSVDQSGSTRIAQLTYGNGEKRYVIAPTSWTVGQRIPAASDAGSAGYPLLGIVVEIISVLVFMSTFLLALLFWYDAMHDARRTAQEINGDRTPGGRWWWFHR